LPDIRPVENPKSLRHAICRVQAIYAFAHLTFKRVSSREAGNRHGHIPRQPDHSARAIASRPAAGIQQDLPQPQFRSQLPAGVLPEFQARRIAGEDEDVAFLNARL
jgi:hypothetical protein